MSCNGECSLTRGQEEQIKALESRISNAEKYFLDHCRKCDEVRCDGCSYDHIKKLLGFNWVIGKALTVGNEEGDKETP